MTYTHYRRYQSPRQRSGFFYFVLFVLVLLILCGLGVLAWKLILRFTEDPKDEAILTLIEGEAEILVWGTTVPEPIQGNITMVQGDEVRTTESGWIQLDFYEGLKITLDQETNFLFTEARVTEEGLTLYFELKEGRIWVSQNLLDTDFVEVIITTQVMDIESQNGQFLISNLPNEEYVYVISGDANVYLLERTETGNTQIDSMKVLKEEYLFFDEAIRQNFLSRTGIILVESFQISQFAKDPFVSWNQN